VALKKKYSLRGVFFADDEPTWDKDWMARFSKELIQRQVKVKWICPSRVDTLDRDVLKLMKLAGCVGIGFGVETGSQKMLNYYRKGTKVEQVHQIFEMCREEGIIARANIMIGGPYETLEDVQQTISLIEQVKPDLIALSVTTPIVGTDMFQDAEDEDLLRKVDLSGYNRFDISTMRRTISDQEISEQIKIVVSKYRRTLLLELLHPIRLLQRRHLLSALLMHWVTMISNPRIILRDISYYLNYQNKERSIIEHTT
jgi:radical SAM superfamily enzyme YgiQ (UPF0313 family)